MNPRFEEAEECAMSGTFRRLQRVEVEEERDGVLRERGAPGDLGAIESQGGEPVNVRRARTGIERVLGTPAGAAWAHIVGGAPATEGERVRRAFDELPKPPAAGLRCVVLLHHATCSRRVPMRRRSFWIAFERIWEILDSV